MDLYPASIASEIKGRKKERKEEEKREKGKREKENEKQNKKRGYTWDSFEIERIQANVGIYVL